MYRQKDSRRASPIQQSRAVLLQVLNEREPGLSDHQAEVAELSVAVGRVKSCRRGMKLLPSLYARRSSMVVRITLSKFMRQMFTCLRMALISASL